MFCFIKSEFNFIEASFILKNSCCRKKWKKYCRHIFCPKISKIFFPKFFPEIFFDFFFELGNWAFGATQIWWKWMRVDGASNWAFGATSFADTGGIISRRWGSRCFRFRVSAQHRPSPHLLPSAATASLSLSRRRRHHSVSGLVSQVWELGRRGRVERDERDRDGGLVRTWEGKFPEKLNCPHKKISETNFCKKTFQKKNFRKKFS